LVLSKPSQKLNHGLYIPVFAEWHIDFSCKKLVEYKNKYDVDGMMIGRAFDWLSWIVDENQTFPGDLEKM